jgi:hypothetical protein
VTWKNVWNEWKWAAVGLVFCLGAYGIRAGAWHAGYGANALGLLGFHFLRFFLLLVAWAILCTLLKQTAKRGVPPSTTRVTLFDIAGGFLILPSCVGCYLAWPVVPLLLTTLLLLVLISTRADGARLSRERWPATVILQVGLPVALFTLTWYFVASTPRAGMHGFGARVEALAGSDRLRAWATDLIAARERREKALPGVVALAAAPFESGPWLAVSVLVAARAGESPWEVARDEIPDWVDGLLGPSQGVRSVMIEQYGYDRCVSLRTGGSAYHLRISVCPSRPSRGTSPWWLGADESECRPGIYLETEGK